MYHVMYKTYLAIDSCNDGGADSHSHPEHNVPVLMDDK